MPWVRQVADEHPCFLPPRGPLGLCLGWGGVERPGAMLARLRAASVEPDKAVGGGFQAEFGGEGDYVHA